MPDERDDLGAGRRAGGAEPSDPLRVRRRRARLGQPRASRRRGGPPAGRRRPPPRPPRRRRPARDRLPAARRTSWPRRGPPLEGLPADAVRHLGQPSSPALRARGTRARGSRRPVSAERRPDRARHRRARRGGRAPSSRPRPSRISAAAPASTPAVDGSSPSCVHAASSPRRSPTASPCCTTARSISSPSSTPSSSAG